MEVLLQNAVHKTLELWVDGGVNGLPNKTVTISNFVGGKYVVFDIGGLTGNNTITLKAFKSSQNLCTGTFVPGVNEVISGVFVGGNCELTGEIGDTVFCDGDNDGFQDLPDEPGIEGVTVTLTCAGPDGQIGTADDIGDTQTTDANGNYLFTGVPSDMDCKVTVDEFSLLPGKEGGACPFEFNVNLDPGESFLDADFCFRKKPGSIGDTVFCDGDNDGFQDLPDEPGIEGVTVTLTCAGDDGQIGTADDIVDTQTTNANGNYLFTGVPTNMDCTVTVDEFSLLPGKEGGACPFEFNVNLDPGESFLDADFCFILPCSECDGKVTQLTLRYNGAAPATIRVEQGKHVIVFGPALVQPDDQFTFNGADKEGTFGKEIKIFVDGTENTKIHTSCSQPIGPGLISGDFEVIEGFSRFGGLICPVDTPPDDGCSECKGKVTQLTLQNNGPEAQITVQQKGKKGKQGDVVFTGIVTNGGQFTFNGTGKDGKLGTEIKVFADGTITDIHTSCSQPIGPGSVFGVFLVIEGFSKDGGLICPLP